MSWTIRDRGQGEYTVTGPDGTEYQVAAHYEHSQSPIPEEAVVIDRITSGGAVLFASGRLLAASLDAEVTGLVEDAVLTAWGY
jgi:hypothetical protein